MEYGGLGCKGEMNEGRTEGRQGGSMQGSKTASKHGHTAVVTCRFTAKRQHLKTFHNFYLTAKGLECPICAIFARQQLSRAKQSYMKRELN